MMYKAFLGVQIKLTIPFDPPDDARIERCLGILISDGRVIHHIASKSLPIHLGSNRTWPRFPSFLFLNK